MANCSLLLNDGSSLVLLNDGLGGILLNDDSCLGESIVSGPGSNYLVWWEQEWGRIRRERADKRKAKKVPKKKRELLDELDDIILELRAQAEDSPPEVKAEVRQIDYFADLAAVNAEISVAQVRAQIALAEAIMREIDDEEAILLALH